MVTGEKVYDFWAERGEFKWANPNRLQSGEILEIGQGAIRLKAPSPQRWKSIMGAARLASVVLGSLMLGGVAALFSKGVESPLTLGLSLSAALAVLSVAVAIINTIRWRLLARGAGKAPINVRIKEVSYHRYYHRLFVSTDGVEFWLTVAAWRRTLQRALELSGQTRTVNPLGSN